MSKEMFTRAQVEALAQYEPIFGHAVRAAWCEYPGLEGLERMQAAWKETTGRDYPYRPGCSTCMMNLVRDCGTLYFAAKEALMGELKEKAKDETFREVQVGDYRPDLTQKAAEVGKTTTEPRKGRKSSKK